MINTEYDLCLEEIKQILTNDIAFDRLVKAYQNNIENPSLTSISFLSIVLRNNNAYSTHMYVKTDIFIPAPQYSYHLHSCRENNNKYPTMLPIFKRAVINDNHTNIDKLPIFLIIQHYQGRKYTGEKKVVHLSLIILLNKKAYSIGLSFDELTAKPYAKVYNQEFYVAQSVIFHPIFYFYNMNTI